MKCVFSLGHEYVALEFADLEKSDFDIDSCQACRNKQSDNMTGTAGAGHRWEGLLGRYLGDSSHPTDPTKKNEAHNEPRLSMNRTRRMIAVIRSWSMAHANSSDHEMTLILLEILVRQHSAPDLGCAILSTVS